MPVFSAMRGSAVAGNCVSASLGTTRSGRYDPVARILVADAILTLYIIQTTFHDPFKAVRLS